MNYSRTITELIEGDKANVDLMKEIDKIYYGDWTLPEELNGIMRTEISTDGHDALRDGTRFLSTHEPKLRITPLAMGEENRNRANEIERALAFEMMKALKRRGNGYQRLINHALKYDRVAVRIDYLPHQKEALKAYSGKGISGYDRYIQDGKFACMVKDPKTVVPYFSEWGLEGVLEYSVQEACEFIKNHGEKRARPIIRKLTKDNPHGFGVYVAVYDYWNDEERAIYANYLGEIQTIDPALVEGSIAILEEKHELPFIPWIVEQGESDYAPDTNTNIMPLLFTAAKFKQADTQNTLLSLMMHETIKVVSSVKDKKEGTNPDVGVQFDYDETGGTANVLPGYKYEKLPADQVDRGLLEGIYYLQNAMAKSTISRDVQNAEFGDRQAFASISRRIDVGTKALNPYKELSERALSKIPRLMLQWLNYKGDDLTVFINDKYKGGMPIVIGEKELDPSKMTFVVEIEPDEPVDRMSQINGAGMLTNMGASPQYALEEVGIPDPNAELDRKFAYERKVIEQQIDLEALKARKMAPIIIQQAQTQAAAQMAAQGMMQPPAAERNVTAINQTANSPQFQQHQQRMMQGQGFDTAIGGRSNVMGDMAAQMAAKRGGGG